MVLHYGGIEGEREVPGGRHGREDGDQLGVIRGRVGRGIGTGKDAVVGPSDVWDVFGGAARHVAASAVEVFRVVGGGEGGALLPGPVAVEALGSIVGDALSRRRNIVWVVAVRAGHAVAAGAPAMARCKLLHFADAARVGPGVVVNEEAQISGDSVAGAIVKRGAVILLDRDISFKVAADADGVAALGCELCGIDDWGLAAVADVRGGIAVAAFTGDAAVAEWRSGVVVESAVVDLRNAAHVAAQAGGVDGDRGRAFADVGETGLHVVAREVRVIRDGRLKKVTVRREKICDAEMTGAEIVCEAVLTVEPGVKRVGIAEPGFSILFTDGVGDAAGSLGEDAGNEPGRRGAAGRRVRRLEIVAGDVGMAAGAGGIGLRDRDRRCTHRSSRRLRMEERTNADASGVESQQEQQAETCPENSLPK